MCVVFVVQLLSCVQLFAIPWTAVCQVSLSFTISQSLLRFISTELVMLSKHFILYCPLLLLLSIFSSIRGFSSELALCMRWQKYWSFSISLSNEYSGFISFRIDCFDLLTGDPGSILWLGKSPGEGNGNPLQYSCLENPMSRRTWQGCKESDMTEDLILSAFFMVQLSHLCITIWKTISFDYMDLCR